MPKTAEPAAMTQDPASLLIEQIANGFMDQIRSPILATPAQVGLEFESVSFPSEDGVPLKGWFIPRTGSDKLIVVNHPRWANRYGLPAHLEPWKSIGAKSGNNFEVSFIQDFRILHDAGYNVLAYDLRNHGESGASEGGLVTTGLHESRDVIGSLDYAASRADLKDMTVGLLSRCLGCNSTIVAMARRPERFEQIRCFVGAQPISVRAFVSRTFEMIGIPPARLADLDARLRQVTGFGLDELSPLEHARGVKVPTFLYQVRNDHMVDPSIVEKIYDNMPVAQKRLFWIEGTTLRFDGYTYLSREPGEILAWLSDFMN